MRFLKTVAILCLTWLPFFSHAQYYSIEPRIPTSLDSFVNRPGVTLAKILDTMNSFVDLSDTCEGSESDEMVEAKQFWQQRVTANDSSGFNMFSKYYFALRAAVLAGRGTCGTGGYQGKWECIGPDSLPVQTAGYVTCVWADPDDTGSNYVLAGTYGGLFKSTNGGKNWDCITDNAPLIGGVFGITSIAVNPPLSQVFFTCDHNQASVFHLRIECQRTGTFTNPFFPS